MISTTFGTTGRRASWLTRTARVWASRYGSGGIRNAHTWPSDNDPGYAHADPGPAPPTPKATAVAALAAGAAVAPGTLSGRVVWCSNGLPTAAPDIQVTVTGTLLSAMTDSDGRFTLNGAPIDQYVIVGARPIDETKAMFGAVMPGVLASTERQLTPGRCT